MELTGDGRATQQRIGVPSCCCNGVRASIACCQRQALSARVADIGVSTVQWFLARPGRCHGLRLSYRGSYILSADHHGSAAAADEPRNGLDA